MASKFLVFVMLYLMVDNSLVLGKIAGEFKIRRNDHWINCIWTTIKDHADQFLVIINLFILFIFKTLNGLNLSKYVGFN